MKNHAAVAHRPALVRDGKTDRRQGFAEWYLALLPVAAAVIRIDNTPALADRHQTIIARAGDVQQYDFFGLGDG
ncbi:MAG: hypothetical protein U5K56_14930 [Halioglobus sp.]|nr:hypothetical protein [Halioglobus sp.]